ncbi:alpha/beta hydrolase [Actinoplanes sp. TBRC 11911]|uniref:alpha/beta hydrolase n=1 Tax=Actinoplanes sp. TBRC 11911 TaxID=2729386 RepID=UPI00145E355E|nr:alpha/beta hydrolase [Actinoplanes sp. TBRC 11911]NMO51728.1 alpha/beta hydrolase [Actinoplanes sp. TBRC 11911]
MRRIVVVSVIVVLAGLIGYATGQSRAAVDVGPSGPFAVGVGMHDWTDRSRYDQFSPNGGEPRTLSAWVWYPAVPGKGAPSRYAPGAWRGLHRYGIAETGFDHIRTGTRVDPPQSPGRFPVVVLLPGLGLSAPQYQAIAAGMAARGYFVAGVTPTYSAKLTVLNGHPVPASRAGDPTDQNGTVLASIVSVWAADARFAAARTAVQYNGHVDPSRVVYVGHELGAAAAVSACHSDEHCAGAVSLAGTMLAGSPALSRPRLLLNSGSSAGRGPVMAYTIGGAGKLAFTDYAVYRLAWPVRRLLPLGSRDGRQTLDITGGYLDAFLATSFRGTPWHAPASPFVRADDVTSG